MSWAGGIGAVALAVSLSSLSAQDIDLAALFDSGVPYATFQDNAHSRRREWRENYRSAAVDPAAIERVRALPGKRRLVAVAEDWCADSANTIPYVAKLVDAVPERLSLHIVNSEAGKALMEAHRTPDGRPATPTVAVLDVAGRLVGVWVERPSALQAWYLEQQEKIAHGELTRRKMDWYREDAGESTISEIVALMEQTAGAPPGGLD